MIGPLEEMADEEGELSELSEEELRTMAYEEVIAYALRKAQLAKKYATLSETDPLTGLGNRRGINKQLERLVSAYKRHGGDLSVVYLDIARLGWVNDNVSHDEGDNLIKRVADIIREQIKRGGDYAGRVGGDEYMMLLPDTSAQGTLTVINRIIAAAAEDLLFKTCQSAINYGIASMEEVLSRELTGTKSPKYVIAQLAREMVTLAEGRMKEEKEGYYQRTGIKRREK